MKDLGRVSVYLGILFGFMPGGLLLHQTQLAKMIIEDFGMTDAKPAPTPVPDGIKLVADMQARAVDVAVYCSLLGKLLFLTHTRPDLAYPVNLVSKFM